MPGYAIFKEGQLVESGIIQVNPADRRNQKLYSITESFRTEFDEPDVLAIENVPPVQFRGGRGLSPWSITAIQRSIGAIISAFNCEYIEIAPKAWQRFKPEGYQKTDEFDAIAIGRCVVETAKLIAKEQEGEK
jgi:Holliday junction resolvasome RuvABC endonuclease subunit